jgi:hypothetical protein
LSIRYSLSLPGAWSDRCVLSTAPRRPNGLTELTRVHRQLFRKREHAPLKTEVGKREVILAPALAKLLRERWLASPFKGKHHFVFGTRSAAASTTGMLAKTFRATSSATASPPLGDFRSIRSGTVTLAADLEGTERRLRQPPARARTRQHHPRDLRAPVRASQPRRHGAFGTGSQLQRDQ